MSSATQRCRDLLIVLVLIPIALPTALLLLLMVTLETRGKPLFRQARVGLNGNEFQIVKIETFREHPKKFSRTEEIGVGDPRLIRFGGTMRRYKLDEVTQLLNVLVGEMSIVGPRPDLPLQAVDYDDIARERLQVKPGLTGLVQVSGNASLTWDQRFVLDAWYVKNRSLLLDLRILLVTPLAILRGEAETA